MAKDPAFLFYPNDWIGGTMGMTFEEKGAYVELLMLQFNRGHMTKHMIYRTVGQLWVKIEDKFIKDKDGLYYNARLETEKEIRKKYTESRRNNILGKNQYKNMIGHTANHMNNHMSTHMENVNINENKSENKEGGEGGRFWESEKKSFLNSGDWIFKFCTDKSIPLEKFDAAAKEFLSDIELKEDFKNLKELKRHFTNWYNDKLKYKNNGTGRNFKKGVPGGKHEIKGEGGY